MTTTDEQLTEQAREIVATLAAGSVTESDPLFPIDLEAAIAATSADPVLLGAVLALGATLSASLAIYIANEHLRRCGLPYDVDDDHRQAEEQVYLVERAREALRIMFDGVTCSTQPNLALS